MERPYIQYSIDDLEVAYEAAAKASDKSTLSRIHFELSFRKTPRARELAKIVSGDLSKSTPSEPIPVTPPAKPAAPHMVRKRLGRETIGFSPTPEQGDALDKFLTGDSLKVNAYAGTGKTSTLQLLASNTRRIGQYIAFNRSIVADAKGKFPDTVNCSTIHSLAFRSTHSKYKRDISKLTGKISSTQLAELLHLKKWRIDQKHTLEPVSQAFLILSTTKRFMQSEATEPDASHVPLHGSLIAAPESTKEAVRDFCLRGANYVWNLMLDEDDPLPLGHDGYLKLWALSDAKVPADFIMLDEAQDTNPVVLGVLKQQSAQMIYVGDKYQQIYEWRGAINAMENIQSANSSYLTTSFRFGPTIAEAATKVLSLLGEHRPIRGNPKISSFIGAGSARTVLARTNASTLAEVIACLDRSLKPHLVGDVNELVDMLKGVQDLKNGKPSLTVPDFFGFSSWAEVVEFSKTPEGEHLLTFVNLVESKGERQLLWALKRIVAEENADLIISTAHKAKGREWDEVRLNGDFIKSLTGDSRKPSLDPAELRLFYVAMTRGRKFIDIPAPVLQLLEIQPTQAPYVQGRVPELRQIWAESATPNNPDVVPEIATPSQPEWRPPRDYSPPSDRPPRTSRSPFKLDQSYRNQNENPPPEAREKRGFWSWLKKLV